MDTATEAAGPTFMVDPTEMLGAEFSCCVPDAAIPLGVTDADDDWTQMEIQPVLQVHCDMHGVVGYAPSRGEAKAIRDRHWREHHRSLR